MNARTFTVGAKTYQRAWVGRCSSCSRVYIFSEIGMPARCMWAGQRCPATYRMSPTVYVVPEDEQEPMFAAFLLGGYRALNPTVGDDEEWRTLEHTGSGVLVPEPQDEIRIQTIRLY